MKIDCSKTENYLREKAKMAKNCDIGCDDCPLSAENNGKNLVCAELEGGHPDEAIKIVQAWSDEHPQKTYKDDFFEKFPDAFRKGNGCPEVPACRLYKQLNDKGCNGYCVDCWNKTMEEELWN